MDHTIDIISLSGPDPILTEVSAKTLTDYYGSSSSPHMSLLKIKS